MADFKTSRILAMATTTGYTEIFTGPPSGQFVIREGGMTFHNTTTTDHNFIIEIRQGTSVAPIYDNTILKKETLIWQRIIRIPSDFTGIFAKTTAAPATAPKVMYTGTIDG